LRALKDNGELGGTHGKNIFKDSASTHCDRRNRIIHMKRFYHFWIALMVVAFASSQIARAESLDESINYLFDYIAHSGVTFIRNGQDHTPQEAVNHIKAKYEHFKSEIKTPEDFIRLSASKSLLTGQPYLIRTRDGKEMPLDVWLTDALKKHRGD
jgi:hypothetical protein